MSLYKSYIVEITCCSSGCTYLDGVPDSFERSSIEVLKRFFGNLKLTEIGAPKLAISDNGHSFTKEVKKITSWDGNITYQRLLG